MTYLAANVSVMDFGADPTGGSDSTTAFNSAITYVAGLGGGVVSAPEGVFKITPSGSPAVGVSFMGTGSAGYQGVRLVGAGVYATTLIKEANGTLVQFSGPTSSVGSGTTHSRFCSVESIGFNGNGFTGNVWQCYYADNLLFRDVYVTSNPDVVLDTAEFWDSRFYNCYVQSCGSTTASATTPNFLLRNSAASSGFGATTDNVNNLYFEGCHFEGAKTGSIWIEQGVSNSNNPNAIFLVNTKMETSAINNGPHLLVDSSCKGIYVNNVYCYSGGFTGGYSTAQDVITWSPQDSLIENVFIATGTASTVANGITLNSTVAGQTSVARNITAIYGSGVPTGNHVAFGTATGNFIVDNCNSNATTPTTLNAALTFNESASSNSILAGLVGGNTFKQFQLNANGAQLFGTGSLAADVQTGRVGTNTWSVSKNLEVGSTTVLGDNGVGEIQLANATTVPTTNPTGGAVAYARNGGWWSRDLNGVVAPMISPSEFSASPTGCLGETYPRLLSSSSAVAIGAVTGTVEMLAVWLPAGLTITNVNWVTGATAAVAPTHWWLGIANSAGLQQAHTADQTSGAIAANTLITKALTGTYTTTTTGLYYILVSVTATTNPTSTGIAIPTNANLTTPLLGGVSATTQSAPGTDGTTTYSIPAATNATGIAYSYLT